MVSKAFRRISHHVPASSWLFLSISREEPWFCLLGLKVEEAIEKFKNHQL
jgi:hypothetical protein